MIFKTNFAQVAIINRKFFCFYLLQVTNYYTKAIYYADILGIQKVKYIVSNANLCDTRFISKEKIDK